jgi:hypothetical protein
MEIVPAVVVALKSSMCSCIRSKKSMILGNRISWLCVRVVCVYDLYNCIIWNNRISFVGGLRGLYG